MAFTTSDLYQQYKAVLQLSNKTDPGKEVSRVYCTEDKYEVKLDLQNFSPDEICVKAVDKCILVEGKHERKGDKVGIISHQLTRRYILPDGVEPQNVTCSLGQDGILTLSAPRSLRRTPPKEVIIPIKKDDATSPVKK